MISYVNLCCFHWKVNWFCLKTFRLHYPPSIHSHDCLSCSHFRSDTHTFKRAIEKNIIWSTGFIPIISVKLESALLLGLCFYSSIPAAKSSLFPHSQILSANYGFWLYKDKSTFVSAVSSQSVRGVFDEKLY